MIGSWTQKRIKHWNIRKKRKKSVDKLSNILWRYLSFICERQNSNSRSWVKLDISRLFLFVHISWYGASQVAQTIKRKWQSTPILLTGKFHGRRSLVSYSSWGCTESDMTEWLHLICTRDSLEQNLSCSILFPVMIWESRTTFTIF